MPGAGDVEVRGAAAAIADREHVVRDEHPERGKRDGHSDHDREQHVERSVLGQVEAGEHGHDEQPGDDELAPLPQPSGRDQRVQAGDEDGGEERHRHRRQRGLVPGAEDLHPERPRASEHVDHEDASDRCHEHRDNGDEQVPPAPPDHQHGERCPPQGQHAERGRGGEHSGAARGPGEPGRADRHEHAQHRVIGDVRGDGHRPHVADQRPRDGHHPDQQQPATAGGAQLPGQRRRLAGWPAPAPHPGGGGRRGSGRRGGLVPTGIERGGGGHDASTDRAAGPQKMKSGSPFIAQTPAAWACSSCRPSHRAR
jgi:hypothetical protein